VHQTAAFPEKALPGLSIPLKGYALTD